MQKLKDIKDSIINKRKLNYKDLNDILKISKKILSVFFILIIVLAVYIVLRVCKELSVFRILVNILKILTPLFIGIVVAWLLNPVVNYMQKKGIRRIIGVSLSYVVLIALIYLILNSIIPLAYNQISDLSQLVPKIISNIESIIDKVLGHFDNIDAINVSELKDKIIGAANGYANGFYNELPNHIVGIVRNIISGAGTFLIGMIIGFFLLLGFNNVGDSLMIFVPSKFQESTKKLTTKITKALRGYVNGALFDASIIFVACSIAFALIGLKSPLLFALFCALMNVIPYAGPYIGGFPAILVAFSQSMGIGIGVTLSIIIIQALEGNIMSPIVMSKTTKLHPVTIIVGLLIFGHFFGIVGMLLSTPIISVGKVVIEFIDSKIHIFSNNEEVILEEE